MMAAAPEATPEVTAVATEAPTAAPTEVAVAPAPTRPSFVDMLTSGDYGSFTTLLAALEATGLTEMASTGGPDT